MTKSSVSRMRFIRRVVASSGFALALMAAAPAGVAAADDSSSSSSSSGPESKSASSDSDSESNDTGEAGAPRSTDATTTDTGSDGVSDGGGGISSSESTESDSSDGTAGSGSGADTAASTGEATSGEDVASSADEDSTEPDVVDELSSVVDVDASNDQSTPVEYAVVTAVVGDDHHVARSVDEMAAATLTADNPRAVEADRWGHAVLVDDEPPRRSEPRSGESSDTEPPLLRPPAIEIPQFSSLPAAITSSDSAKVTEFIGPADGDALVAVADRWPMSKPFDGFDQTPTGEGMILLNQSAVASGMLHRRSRADGQEYIPAFDLGERLVVPKSTIAELSLDTHTSQAQAAESDDQAGQPGTLGAPDIADESEATPGTAELTESEYNEPEAVAAEDGVPVESLAAPAVSADESAQSALAAARALTAGSASDPDIDNRFLDPGDADWHAPIGGAYPPEGLSYSVPGDGSGSVVIHNDSGQDVAVISVYYPHTSDHGLVVIESGESYAVPRESADGMSAYWVQTERQGGDARVVGRILVIESSAFGPTVGVTPVGENTVYVPLQGSTTPDYAAEDPDDRFFDPADQAEYVGTVYANPESAGVSYSVHDAEHVTIHNDGANDITIMQSTAGGQTLTFEVLQPGEYGTYANVPGNPVVLAVQAPRAADGSIVLLGTVTRYSVDRNLVSVSPGNGIPGIPDHDAIPPENSAPGGELVAQTKEASDRFVVYVPQVNDVDGDSLTYTVYQLPERGTVTINHPDGTINYTATNPDDLHDGGVQDSFIVTVSDGRGGTGHLTANVNFMFTAVDNTAPQLTAIGGQDDVGRGTWTVTVNDAEDDLGVGISTRPVHGGVELVQNGDGTFTVTYEPDLARAHVGAYDDSFSLVTNDGHGGVVEVPVALHVPFYNQSPSLTIRIPEGGGGDYIGSATFDIVTSDGDGDSVTISSVSTSDGGTVTVVDGVLHYTPRSFEGGYYFDTITVVVDDGHGRKQTTIEHVTVANTEALPWVESGQGHILVFSERANNGSDLHRVMLAALDQPHNLDRADGLIAEIGRSNLAVPLQGYPSMLQRYRDSLLPAEPETPDWGTPTPVDSEESGGSDHEAPAGAGDPSDTGGTDELSVLEFFLREVAPAEIYDALGNTLNIVGSLVGNDYYAVATATAQLNPIIGDLLNGDYESAAFRVLKLTNDALDIAVSIGGSLPARANLAVALAIGAGQIWLYVAEQALEIDPDSFDDVVQYAREHPGEVWWEVGEAVVTVVRELGLDLVDGFVSVQGKPLLR